MHTIHKENVLVKFADDTDLIVAAANEGTCTAELMNITDWATRNNLTLNESKSIEIVFRNPASKSNQTREPPPTPMGITRKSEIKTLGVTLSQGFSMKTHADNVITSCGQVCMRWKSWSHTAYHKSVCMSSSSPPSCHGSCMHPKRGTDSRVRRISVDWIRLYEVSQVVIRIAGSTVIPTAMWEERWRFTRINSFKQKPCSCGSPSSSQENRLRSQDQNSWLCPALC